MTLSTAPAPLFQETPTLKSSEIPCAAQQPNFAILNRAISDISAEKKAEASSLTTEVLWNDDTLTAAYLAHALSEKTPDEIATLVQRVSEITESLTHQGMKPAVIEAVFLRNFKQYLLSTPKATKDTRFATFRVIQ